MQKLAAGKTFNRKIRAIQLLAEVALTSGDSKEAERWEGALRELEGAEGTGWRFYRAQRLMNQVVKPESNSPEFLREAMHLQNEIERLRPNWAPGYLLKARLCQLGPSTDTEAAIGAYERAIKLGRRDIRIYQELISMLYQQNRLVTAGAYLEQLRATVQLPPELTVLGMAIDAQHGNLPRAISTARDEVAREPNDAVRLIRLGQLLALQPTAAPGSFHPEAEATLAAGQGPGACGPSHMVRAVVVLCRLCEHCVAAGHWCRPARGSRRQSTAQGAGGNARHPRKGSALLPCGRPFTAQAAGRGGPLLSASRRGKPRPLGSSIGGRQTLLHPRP